MRIIDIKKHFASFPLDENYLLAAVRYVEMNPVATGLAEQPGESPWSSAHTHLAWEDAYLATASPLLAMVGN